MSKQHIQPPDLFESSNFGYTQVVTSPPGKFVFLAGQTALGRDFKIVGENDLEAQTGAALENLRLALEAAGAQPGDVTSLRIYVPDYTAAKAGKIGPALGRFFGSAPPAAQTLIGVQALGMPELMIEIEATAVVN